MIVEDLASVSGSSLLKMTFIPPEITCPPDMTVECESDIPEPDVNSVVATDSCSSVTVTHLRDEVSYSGEPGGPCSGELYRYYEAADPCNNVASCVQVFTILDFCGPNSPCNDICDSEVPFFRVDLSENPDSNWVSPEVARDGSCCDGTNNTQCIQFDLSLSDKTHAVQVEIASGPVPPGELTLDIGCGNEQPLGEIICLEPGQSYTLILCAPGSDLNTYSIQAYGTGSLPDNNNNGVPDVCDEPCNATIPVQFEDCLTIYDGYDSTNCVVLSPMVLDGVEPFNYQWSTGETTDSITLCTRYDLTVFVTVTDTKGCVGKASTGVNVIDVRCPHQPGGILVCHYNPVTRLYTTECVDSSEVEQRLAQGDELGPCGADPCEPNNPPVYTGGGTGFSKPVPGGPRPLVSGNEGSPADVIFPNPASGHTTIQFGLDDAMAVRILVFDAQGRVVHVSSHNGFKGINQVELDTESFGHGIYLVQLQMADETRLMKFVRASN